MCMYVCSYIFCICMYLCMYVCIIGGAPSTGFAFCVTPVMYMWLKLIIIKNNNKTIFKTNIKLY